MLTSSAFDITHAICKTLARFSVGLRVWWQGECRPGIDMTHDYSNRCCRSDVFAHHPMVCKVGRGSLVLLSLGTVVEYTREPQNADESREPER